MLLGPAIRDSDRMTGTRSESQNKIATSTAEPSTGKRVNRARKPTETETHANNYSKKDTMIRARDTVSWLRIFRDELSLMNRRKIGRPFEYTNSMIVWILLLLGLNNMDWRMATSDACGQFEDLRRHGVLHRYGLQDVSFPDFTTVFRRARRLFAESLVAENGRDDKILSSSVSPNVKKRCRPGAVDSTGFNLSNTNLWRKSKWGVGPAFRGWIKMHALVDVDTDEIIAYILTTDRMGDNTAFRMLTDLAFAGGHVMSAVYADSAYEAKDNWRDSEERGYTLVVKFKSNCNGRSNGCMARGEAAREYLSMPYDEWRRKTKYGRRWKAECTFSDFKRLIGETVAAVTDTGISLEMFIKTMAFNFYKDVRAQVLGVTGNGVVVGGA